MVQGLESRESLGRDAPKGLKRMNTLNHSLAVELIRWATDTIRAQHETIQHERETIRQQQATIQQFLDDAAWRTRWHHRLGRGRVEAEGRFYERLERQCEKAARA